MTKVIVEIEFREVTNRKTALEVLEDMKELALTINYGKWTTEYDNVMVSIKSFEAEESPSNIEQSAT